MRYLYCRVSSKHQNLDRQLAIAKSFDNIDEIFSDKESGKNFERAEYKRMKSIVKSGDEIIVKEFDRLGRNKEETKAEIKWFNDNGVVLRILDLPTTLVDFNGQEWIGEMITNILIEVLGSMAENERNKIGKRQKEGIAAAKERGVQFGRPRKEYPDFEKILKKQKDGEITVDEGCGILGIGRTQWYRLIKGAA